MQKSYRKNIRRDFRSNLNRFLSLFGIVALGVMMLTGLVSFAPSMRTAGQCSSFPPTRLRIPRPI